MKSLVSKCVIICLSCLFLHCSTSHSRDVTRNDGSTIREGSPQFLKVDPEWQIQRTHDHIDLTGKWRASCVSTGDCWYWTSSRLLSQQQKHLKEIPVQLGQDEYLLDVFPLANGSGWVVSSAGLFKISHPRAERIRVAIPDFDARKGRIYAVHFENEKQGWIAGGVYRPLVDQEPAPNNALSDDRTQVLIGALARTSDGGVNWETKKFKKTMGRFVQIVFSQQVGLVSGDAGLESTSDGGETWSDVLSTLSRKDPRDRLEVTAMFVLNARRCWAGVSGAQILTSLDGSKTWTVIDPASELNDETPVFSGIVFADERNGLALQDKLGAGQLYKTNDGGKNWAPVKLNTGLSGLALVPGRNYIVAVGKDGLYSFRPI